MRDRIYIYSFSTSNRVCLYNKLCETVKLSEGVTVKISTIAKNYEVLRCETGKSERLRKDKRGQT